MLSRSLHDPAAGRCCLGLPEAALRAPSMLFLAWSRGELTWDGRLGSLERAGRLGRTLADLLNPCLGEPTAVAGRALSRPIGRAPGLTLVVSDFFWPNLALAGGRTYFAVLVS